MKNKFYYMHAKRIIPCLDIKDGRTVKGVNFINLRDAGDPVELGARYTKEGADELVFLDITATNERRKTLINLVEDLAKVVNIPFTVGGGINSVENVSELLIAGADKISINSAALRNPQIIDDLAMEFGSQCIVVALDVKESADSWQVFMNGGRVKTKKRAMQWAIEMENRGAGELLLTSMDHDGNKNGFAIELTKIISEAVNIPVIASGGAGKEEHFLEVFKEGKADAALAASIFHFGEIPITKLKSYLNGQGISVRL